jgi:hypothetical protein
MKPGDIVKLRADLGEPHLVLVLEVDPPGGYVRVLMDGKPTWVPMSYVIWSAEGS